MDYDETATLILENSIETRTIEQRLLVWICNKQEMCQYEEVISAIDDLIKCVRSGKVKVV